MTVTIVPNTGKSSAGEVALRAAQILRSHGAAVLMDQALQPAFNIAGVQYLPFDDCLYKTDVILTIGGDGTILHVANLTLNYHKPILGINLGRCGFLATCEVDELEAKLSAVAEGQYNLDPRMLLYVQVLGDDEWEGHALNDVVVTKGRLQQAIDFSVYCDDILVEHFRGDGVIVATPTGSTAYSLAAGGPILDSQTKGIVVTPLCPHSLATPPMVFAQERKLNICVVSGLVNAKNIMEKVKRGEANYHLIEVMACRRGCIMGGGQPPRAGVRTKAARSKGIYSADNVSIIKKPDENPMVMALYEGLLKGKTHELLHNQEY